MLALNAVGIPPSQIPAKIEGIPFGQDVVSGTTTLHTLWVANDNDYLQDYADPNTNPNLFYVFGFTTRISVLRCT